MSGREFLMPRLCWAPCAGRPPSANRDFNGDGGSRRGGTGRSWQAHKRLHPHGDARHEGRSRKSAIQRLKEERPRMLTACTIMS
ncbi:hypothetical protein AOLI_G00329700 [Acnodon oligacanthus]